MVDALKTFYNRRKVTEIADKIRAVYPTFKHETFVRTATRGLEQLELVPRARHIMRALRQHLPDDYEEAAVILTNALGPRMASTEGNGMAPFIYLPWVLYIAEYGLDHLDTSLDLQYEVTKRFTAEFSLRFFIERYPRETFARLREWAHDPDVHVRRLVSEGTRSRLPWAPRLRLVQKDPTPVLELLELLKDDPELYVRRSVANNLNDIGKDHPEILFETCRRWLQDATPEREWLVKHALRSAVKRGEAGALKVLGYHNRAVVTIRNVRIEPRRPQIGDTVRLSFDVASTTRRKQSLLVDTRVHFVKADGGTRPKVFKLKTIDLPAGKSIPLATTISLRQLTTRKHYAGTHEVEALINGVAYSLGSFKLKAGK